MFEDVLLDALSVVTMSHNHDFARATAALSTVEGGLLVLVAGHLSADAAREIAAARRHGRQGIALLLATSTWANQPTQSSHNGHSGQDGADLQDLPPLSLKHSEDLRAGREAAPGDTAAAAAVLNAGGWRVITVDAATPLAVAWQRLPRTGSVSIPVNPSGLGAAAG